MDRQTNKRDRKKQKELVIERDMEKQRQRERHRGKIFKENKRHLETEIDREEIERDRVKLIAKDTSRNKIY